MNISILSPINSLYMGYVSGTGRALWCISFFMQRILRLDANSRYLKHFTSRLLHPDSLMIEGDCHYVRRSFLVSGGCYINAADGLSIGKGTIWGPNVSIISQVHDINDFDSAPRTRGIKIGQNCWIGAGSVILPNVHLGDRTIVGANAVVTKSFSEGHVVLAGVPAKAVRDLPVNRQTEHNSL
jgi:acetyltransferase-like isoleucine patch superfamily enzyme